jgi:NADPH:quinone reductase-like Zn-dependent oxidoreductase
MPTTMQAIVKARAAHGIEMREVPVPTPGPGEVLVRVQVASVCVNRSAHLQLGPLGEGPHPPAAHSRS